MHHSVYKSIRHHNALIILLSSIAALVLISACASPSKQVPFNIVQCMDTIPKKVRGLNILSGPRTEQSIIRDMVPAVCYGHVLYHNMKNSGEEINAGSIIVRITVEYTGEVYKALVEESTIKSKQFVQKVSDQIMDTDFVGWAKDESDTEFFYTLTFGR